MKHSLQVQISTLVLIRTVFNTMIRMVYPFLPVFQRGLGVDLWMLSLALTLRSALGIMGPFLASVADSRGRKAGMLLGAALFTGSVGLMAAWPTYGLFVVALVGSLVGNFVFIPSMQAYLGDRVPYERRGLALAVTEFGWSLSFILGIPLVGAAIERWGWQAPFPFLAALGALGLAVLAYLLPADPALSGPRPNFWGNLRKVFSFPAALAGIGLGMALSGGNELVNLIFGVWIEDSFGVKIAALATASAIIGISELSAEGMVSGLADRLGKKRAVRIGLVGNMLAALALPLLGNSLEGALIGLFLLYLSFEFSLVSSIPLMTQVMPEVRATLMASFIACMALGRAFGALLSPLLYAAGPPDGPAGRILPVALGGAVINLLALLALRYVHEQKAQLTPP